MRSVNRELWRKKLITVQHRTHLAALKSSLKSTQKGTCIILLLHCLKRFRFIFKQSTTPSKRTNLQIEPQKESFFIEDASHWKVHVVNVVSFMKSKPLPLDTWSSRKEMWCFGIRCIVDCLPSKRRLTKWDRLFPSGALGFTAAMEDCINAKYLKTDISGFFLHQYTPEAHSLCMSYIMQPLLYIHGPWWHYKCQSIVRPGFDLWFYHKLKSNASWAEMVQVSHRVS